MTLTELRVEPLALRAIVDQGARIKTDLNRSPGDRSDAQRFLAG